MAKIKIVYKPLSKEEQDKFDKSQQEFYEKYIKHRKENNMTDKKKLSTEKQIAIYDMLDAKCTVTDEGVQGFMTWEQIRGVYNSIIEETKEIDFEKELRKYFGQVKDFTLCMNIAKKFYDKGYFDGHIHDGDKIVHVDRRQVNVSRFRRVAKPLEAHVSEGLEEEVKKLWREINTGHEYAILDSYNILYGICLDIANWQKEQFKKNRLKHCNSITNEQAELEQCFIDQQLDKYNRMPTFIDAIEYGMSLHKEQMMKDATEAYIWRNRYTKQNVLNGFDETCDAIQKFNGGDKVKVIVTKEG